MKRLFVAILILYATSALAQPIPIIHPNPGGGGGGGNSVVTDNLTLSGNGASAGNALKATGKGLNVGMGGTQANLPGFDNVINVLNFGAKCDGVTDDYAALQAAINAGCGITALGQNPSSTGRFSIYVPTGTCLFSQPLRLPCGKINFGGSGPSSTNLNANYVGPGILAEPYGANNLQLTTALLTGTGQALITNGCSGANCGSVFLNEVVGPFQKTAALNLNGQAAFSVELTFKPSATPAGFSTILASHTTNVSASGTKSALQIISDSSGTGALECIADIGGTLKTVPASSLPVLSNGTIYDIDCDYDGSNLRLFVGTPGNTTTMYGPVAATGTLTVENFNVMEIPSIFENSWPNDGGLGLNPWAGTLDSIRISNISRHTSTYTAPTAKLTADNNTMLLMNFVTTGYVSDGLQQVGVQSGTQYLPVRGTNGGYTVPNQYIHDFTTNRPFIQTWGDGSTIARISASVPGGYSQQTACIDFYAGDFFSARQDITGSGCPIGVEYMGDSESSDINVHASPISAGVCFVNGGGGGEDDRHPTCTDPGTNVYDWISYGSFYNVTFPFDDAEFATNNSLLGIMWLDDMNDNINLPQFVAGGATSPNASYFVISGGGPVEIHEPDLLGNAVDVINILKAPTVPVAISGIYDNGGSPGPLSNSLGDVTTPGCGGKIALVSGAGTVTNSCIHPNSICAATDITQSANGCTLGTPIFRSIHVTGTGTDVCKVVCQ